MAAGPRRVEGFLDGIPLPMLAVDREARVIAANPLALALFGPGLVGRPFVTVLRHPAVVQAVDWVLDPEGVPAPTPDQTLPTAPDGVATLRATCVADGREILAEVTVAPLPSPLGRGATVAVLDLSLIHI